jgi:hypothetical protein
MLEQRHIFGYRFSHFVGCKPRSKLNHKKTEHGNPI